MIYHSLQCLEPPVEYFCNYCFTMEKTGIERREKRNRNKKPLTLNAHVSDEYSPEK